MRNRASNTGGVTFDQIFRAIGDPHRLQILLLLREKEMSAGEILKALDVVQSTLSHHMKSLVDAGAVSAVRHGKWTYYSLNTEVLSEAVRYLDEFTGGTKVRADFVQRSADAASPVFSTVETPVRQEEKSSRQEDKPAKEKTDKGSVSSEPREEKKKSKKGKKGKKNKK